MNYQLVVGEREVETGTVSVRTRASSVTVAPVEDRVEINAPLVALPNSRLSATGVITSSHKQDVVANNLANSATNLANTITNLRRALFAQTLFRHTELSGDLFIEAGDGTGACWPVEEGGCCDASHKNARTGLLGLLFVAFVLGRFTRLIQPLFVRIQRLAKAR